MDPCFFLKALKGSAHFWAYQTHHRSIDFRVFHLNWKPVIHSFVQMFQVGFHFHLCCCLLTGSSSSYRWSCVCPVHDPSPSTLNLWSWFLPPDRLTQSRVRVQSNQSPPGSASEFWCTPLPTHRAVCPWVHLSIIYSYDPRNFQLLLINFHQQKGPQWAEGSSEAETLPQCHW